MRLQLLYPELKANQAASKRHNVERFNFFYSAIQFLERFNRAALAAKEKLRYWLQLQPITEVGLKIRKDVDDWPCFVSTP